MASRKPSSISRRAKAIHQQDKRNISAGEYVARHIGQNSGGEITKVVRPKPWALGRDPGLRHSKCVARKYASFARVASGGCITGRLRIQRDSCSTLAYASESISTPSPLESDASFDPEKHRHRGVPSAAEKASCGADEVFVCGGVRARKGAVRREGGDPKQSDCQVRRGWVDEPSSLVKNSLRRVLWRFCVDLILYVRSASLTAAINRA